MPVSAFGHIYLQRARRSPLALSPLWRHRSNALLNGIPWLTALKRPADGLERKHGHIHSMMSPSVRSPAKRKPLNLQTSLCTNVNWFPGIGRADYMQISSLATTVDRFCVFVRLSGRMTNGSSGKSQTGQHHLVFLEAGIPWIIHDKWTTAANILRNHQSFDICSHSLLCI